MGSSASTPQATQEQQDIKHLGDRFPFGDDELVRLYRCYQELQNNSKERVSFLSDLASHCVSLPPGDLDEDGIKLQARKDQCKVLLQVVENEILPEGFGARLERAAFLLKSDWDADTKHQVVKEKEDEYLRINRLEHFFDGLANCSRRGGRAALGTLFQCCVEGDSHIPANSKDLVDAKGEEIKANATKVLNLAYRLSLASAFLSTSEEDMVALLPAKDAIQSDALQSLSHSCLDFVKRKRSRENPYGELPPDSDLEKGMVSKMDFLEWSEAASPLLSSILPTFMHSILFPDKPYAPSRTGFYFPRIPSESTFFQTANSTLLFSFASMSSALGGTWHRLYTSASDGLSFNRLQNSLLGYGGPTLIIIRATNGGIFGAFTASQWKESKDYYGNSDCFLYQLLPTTAVYRPSGSHKNYMYCNSEARSRGYDKLPHGIGFGGSTDSSPRLFIAESFEGCVASSQDLTFEKGPLLPRAPQQGLHQKHFEIDQLEVWGVGGDSVVAEALESRSRQRELAAANIRKARKVDKAAFLDDFRSGLIESKAFKHRGEIQGRADCDVDDRNKKNAYK